MGLFSSSGVPIADYDKLKEANETLQNNNTALHHRIEELENELHSNAKQSIKSTADSLMEMQNEHLRLNLVDIQGNMAESVSASKQSLSNTTSLVESISDISKKTNNVVATLDGLNELSNTSMHTVHGLAE
ncbi:MAG: chemotaxis protein, partial [Sulfurimonas sp.]|nr:chemotaxis protein [Sulfurimonas sp.]